MPKRENKPLHVLLDCEKVKYPHTGLWAFILELGVELYRESTSRNSKVTALLKKRNIGILGDRISYKEFCFWHKIYFRPNARYTIFHQLFQEGKLRPKGSQKVVLTIHDLNCLYEKQGKRKDISLTKIQQNIDRADVLVAISEFTKRDILSHFDIGARPLKVIYNGCSPYTGVIPARPSTYRPNHPFIFTIGTVLEKKNFHVLPCLLVDNSYELIIAGKLSDYKDRIIEQAQLYGVSHRVHIIGAIEESDKHWYYKHCVAFVFPSIAEGFGLPIVEAMQYGKPLFLSQHTSIPEIGGEDAFYFNREFAPKQMQQEFEQGMASFSIDHSEALARRISRFSWRRAAEEYWDIYESLIPDR